jgi:hypothetical protein
MKPPATTEEEREAAADRCSHLELVVYKPPPLEILHPAKRRTRTRERVDDGDRTKLAVIVALAALALMTLQRSMQHAAESPSKRWRRAPPSRGRADDASAIRWWGAQR